MDLKEKLYRYDAWANGLIYDSIVSLEDDAVREEAIKHFQHLLAAQITWHGRVKGNEDTAYVWKEKTSLVTCKKWMDESGALLKEMTQMENQMIDHSNSKCEQFSVSLDDIYHHVIIHGQHHRAQIALIIRKSGSTPPPTDFIFYCRSEL